MYADALHSNDATSFPEDTQFPARKREAISDSLKV